ncbi:MAG: universal stress protein [Bdellovibrionales bacterium]
MKTAVLAIDATRDSSSAVENLCNGLIRFQRAGLLEDLHLASVIHPDSFLLPNSYYREEKYDLGKRAGYELQNKLNPNLKVHSSKLLITENQSMDEHIDSILELAREVNADALIVGTSQRTSLSYMVQGSFAEAASLKSPLPVLVFGAVAGSVRNSHRPSLLVVFSPSDPPSAEARKWIVKLALDMKASILLLLLDDQNRWWAIDREMNRETAELIRREFAMEGILSVAIRKEPVLPGQVASVADQEQAWLTVFCSNSATARKPMFSPSINGRIIADMSRPILVLKEVTYDSRIESARSDDSHTDHDQIERADQFRQRVDAFTWSPPLARFERP